jgi:hypothetical protein
VRDNARREAQVAEDHVLDSRVEERLAPCPDLDRLLLDEVEDDGEIVCAQAPERVLVAPDLPEVLTVAVDVEKSAEVASCDELFQLRDPGVVEQEVARHEDEPALLGESDELLTEGRRQCQRLLDEDVLAGQERFARQLEMRHDRRGDGDRVERLVREEILEECRFAGIWKAPAVTLDPTFVTITDPGEGGAVQVVQVPRQIRAPVAEPNRPYGERLTRQRAPASFRLQTGARPRPRSPAYLPQYAGSLRPCLSRFSRGSRRATSPGGPREFPYAAVRRPVVPGRVAEVDDELGALGEAVVVDARMSSHDGDAVGIRQRAVEVLRGEAVLGQLRNVRVVVRDLGALVPEQADELEGGALP